MSWILHTNILLFLLYSWMNFEIGRGNNYVKFSDVTVTLIAPQMCMFKGDI